MKHIRDMIKGDLTVLIKGDVKDEESAIAEAFSNLFWPTIGRNSRWPKFTKTLRYFQKDTNRGGPVSDVLTPEEIADILVLAGVYKNQGGAMLDMENILDLRLSVMSGADYIWVEKKGGYYLRTKYSMD
ncbi:hypothetical protein CEE44_00625 [Candidatus Woesearchaeota archaeon B3_Woes]|nr:MAG: hypothetical protein CEE44_00625 [Candidatus Woesearchaeota archaeon B3_Woes]